MKTFHICIHRWPLLMIPLLFAYCSRKADVVRELHFVDLLNSQNQIFQSYPNELNRVLLDAILKQDLPVFDIDYLSTGEISPLDPAAFAQRVIDPYGIPEYLRPANSADTVSFVSEYFSSMTLIGLDDLQSDGQILTKYINFYHPGAATPTGIDTYVCSVRFEDAIHYLGKRQPALLWYQFQIPEWGLYSKRLFVPDFRTASNLALDMLALTDSSQLTSRLTRPLKYQDLKYYTKNEGRFLRSRFEERDEGILTIAYKNDSVYFELAQFTFPDMMMVAQKKGNPYSASILPLSAAVLNKKLAVADRSRVISQNGNFMEPIAGTDKLSRKFPGKGSYNPKPLSGSQAFYFRTTEVLLGDDMLPGLEGLPITLYEAVRKGSLTAYQNDSLQNRLLPGDFFDNMIFNDLDSVPAPPEWLQLYQVIVETIFLQDGTIVRQAPIGIGLFLPGKVVPEGFNRPIGYFLVNEVNMFLEARNMSKLDLKTLRGFPLSSWNIGLYVE